MSVRADAPLDRCDSCGKGALSQNPKEGDDEKPWPQKTAEGKTRGLIFDVIRDS